MLGGTQRFSSNKIKKEVFMAAIIAGKLGNIKKLKEILGEDEWASIVDGLRQRIESCDDNGQKNKYCALCGMKVNCKKLRVPRKCEKCGAPFDISINIVFLIYFLASLFLIVFTLCLVKSIIKNQWMLYVILILDIVIIPNCVERKLFQIGIMSIKIWNKK